MRPKYEDHSQTWQCPICKKGFMYYGEAMAHRCSSKTGDMREEIIELLDLRHKIGSDLWQRTISHHETFQSVYGNGRIVDTFSSPYLEKQ